MPEKPAGDKTESATPRRRSKARDEGNVARSMDLTSVAVLFAGVMALYFSAGELLDSVTGLMTATYNNIASIAITPATLPGQFSFTLRYIVSSMAPIVFMVVFAGIAINVSQVGILFSKKALKMKFNKLNPLSGFKRIFSMRSVVGLIKGLFKLFIVTYICYLVIIKRADSYWILTNVTVFQALVFIGQILFELALKIGFALLVLAIADFAYQKYEYEKKLKMTKQEVKDEQKQYEGSQETKGRIRSIQRQLARKRMLAAVPAATVVVTNPTHVAVALKYEPLKNTDAPIVVAKGKRKIAEKIKAIARENQVPVIENKLLARTLYDVTEVGMEIPVVLYQAVAEILAQVYQMNQSSKPVTGGYSYV